MPRIDRQEIETAEHDAEIIVVNNASTDGTKSVALSYPSVIVVDEPRKGIVRARDAGYRAATGRSHRKHRRRQHAARRMARKSVSRSFPGTRSLPHFRGPSSTTTSRGFTGFRPVSSTTIGYVTYLLNHFVLRKGGMLQGGNFVVRRSALEAIGGYDRSIDFYGEDTDIARRMQKAGRIKFTFRLPMYSSGRRMAKEGLFATGVRYALNYLWIIFFKRPFNTRSTDIRFEAGHRPAITRGRPGFEKSRRSCTLPGFPGVNTFFTIRSFSINRQTVLYGRNAQRAQLRTQDKEEPFDDGPCST